ncbi:MAG: endonuclease MutS2 [Cyanobacteria bacterium]|nr:endonuclease MutS2 [Cyanobacteriota bacterium]MDW8200888.1 endonuclease MutS2 [Cyanobacteriota bacterium SKYGB_h_bin112]
MIQTETLDLLEWSRLCQHVATFAATKLGTMAARQLPIPDSQTESERLLAQTREAYHLEALPTGGLSFEGIQDIGEALARSTVRGLLTGTELIAIATTLAGMRNVRRLIESQPNVPTLAALVADLRTHPDLEQAIHHCIDDQGKVSDRASPKLADLRERLRTLRQDIYQKLQNILHQKAGAIQEATITQRHDRFVIPVKASQKDAIPGIIHDTSTTGATLYVEPNSTVPMNNQLQQLLRQEQAEEEAVRRQLTEQVAAVHEDLEHLLAIATILDLATARARYSHWLGANPPRFITIGSPPPTSSDESAQRDAAPSEPIVLRQLRHPLLVWQQQHEQGKPVVPIDVVIQPSIRVVAITGPNTGGKTAALKTIGLAAVMAKAGLFIPAREPVDIPWFTYILADIGDEQSLQQSLSTFSGHVRRIGRILTQLFGEAESELQTSESQTFKSQTFESPISHEQVFDKQGTYTQGATNPASAQPGASDRSSLATTPETPYGNGFASLHPSLVLLDEVGAGTDPSEGSALAIALLQYLAERVQLTIATTHFGELKALKYQDPRFENASVEFDDASLAPTYRLLWGIPGRSNALTIAQRLGLPIEIIDRARNYVGGFSQDINSVISGLEAQRREQEIKAKAAADLLASAEQLYQQVSSRAQALQARERELQLAQEQAVQQAIAQAKEDIARVIRQLQQGPATAQAAQQATQALDQLAQQHLPSQRIAPSRPNFIPKVGDRVRIPSVGQTAEVLAIDDQDNTLTVRFGMMKMSVRLEDVESLDGQKVQLAQTSTKATPVNASANSASEQSATPLTIRTSRNTLDLRGYRVADAEPLLDRAIAEGDGAVWIIHGHGTGRLRQGVHEFLKQHPRVSRFTLAEPQDGGSGVTIAYLT